MRTPDDPLHGLTILERGWLSSNNTVIHAAPGEAGALLVDTSHVNHAEQTIALLRHALRGDALAGIVNTHLHSDHCGGNAALQAAFGAPIAIPPGQAEAIRAWAADAAPQAEFSWEATGQRMQRFEVQQVLVPGEALRAGGRDWQVLEAPGHDPDSVMLFDAERGVLLSADALWENGFGIVFPEIEGEPGFDDVAAVLDTIAALPVKVVIPGHGRPFSDLAGALDRARTRLAGFQSDPARHARHALKVLLKYHLMEERRQPRDALIRWAGEAPLLRQLWARFPPRGVASADAWTGQVLDELLAAGVLRQEGDEVVDA